MENFASFSSSSSSSSSPNTHILPVNDLSLYQNNDLQQFMTNPCPYEYSYACQGGQVDQAVNQTAFHSFPNANSAFPLLTSTPENGCEIVGPTPSPLVYSGGNLGQEMRGFLDPQRTKIARIKRKLARQRTLNLTRNNSSSSSSSSSSNSNANSNSNPSSNELDSRRLVTYKDHANNGVKGDQFRFFESNNKMLRVLLVKELKNSDVGSLGRIVLPKREAEVNLPMLSDKEGIKILMRDTDSHQSWAFKYKFWSNNKSRMYVLENTGDFVKQNGLEMGDSLTIYEDESKNLHFSIKKMEKAEEETEKAKEEKESNNEMGYAAEALDYPPRDEDEASLALLIEQLKHEEQQHDMTLTIIDEDPTRASHVNDGHHGVLPHVHTYGFPF